MYCSNCKDDHKLEYERCSDTVHSELYACLENCPSFELDCHHQCSVDFEEGLVSCPCMEKCPLGCPCPDYKCSNSQLDFVLFRNIPSTKVNMRVNINVGVSKLDVVQFEPLLMNGHNNRQGSCSIILKNRVYILGGHFDSEGSFDERYRQLMVHTENQQMITLIDLPFEVHYGLCTSYNNNGSGDHGLVCGPNSSERKHCYTMNNKDDILYPTYTPAASVSMNYLHGGMNHFKHQAVIFFGTTGGKTELYNENKDKWTQIADNPELVGYSYFSHVNFRGSVYTFGGRLNGNRDEIFDRVYNYGYQSFILIILKKISRNY